MKPRNKIAVIFTFSALALACPAFSQDDDASTEAESKEEAPVNETANQIEQAAQIEAAGAEGNPVLNASDSGDAAETVEGTLRDDSYENAETDQKVANALSDQGYFAAGVGSSKEEFIEALKNFQTLNGMAPTGVITPEVLSKLGIMGDEFAPE
jgi:hypothetical protein